ncbi:MAG: nitrate/nitrite transporter [Pseudonocardia sp.]
MTTTLPATPPAPGGTAPVPARGGRAAWAVLAAAAAAYVVAVMQRTSLGATGLDAADRFGISPGLLALFVFLQVGVYAAGQIPAGLLVDRFGARAMLTSSGALLAAGQLLLALATSLGTAAAARVLVGAGDALVFASVMALVPRWFAPRRVPLVTQMTTITGQLGQVLSTVPLIVVLGAVGWPTTFATAAAVSLAAAVLVLAVVRNGPAGTWRPGAPIAPRALAGQLRAVWARPGTRLGFFGHMGTQFSMMVFSLLWGVPYLVTAHGLDRLAAGGLVTLLVVASVCVGPLLGALTARHPLRRSWLMLGVIGAGATVWTAILLLPGPAPLWLLVLLVLVLAAGGPGSVVGLDIARTANPVANAAVAQGMVNIGGFGATLVVLLGMGGVLTALGGFTPEAFRVAWLLQYAVWAIAVTGLVLARREARRLDAARGVVPRPVTEVLAGMLGRRRQVRT